MLSLTAVVYWSMDAKLEAVASFMFQCVVQKMKDRLCVDIDWWELLVGLWKASGFSTSTFGKMSNTLAI